MFNLFFAGSRQNDDRHIIEKKANRLYSYANDKKHIQKFIETEDRGPLIVDSGAYSVAHTQIIVDIDKYIEYINDNTVIEYFIELDVIPYPVLNREIAKFTASESWNNYLYMINRLDEPFKLLPVFHFGEDLKYLKQILEFRYKGEKIPFMCIGGRHGVSVIKQEKYFETIFRTIQNSSNPDIKVHVLGMTILTTLEKFPFYSADSTTHLQNSIYGLIMTPYGKFNVSERNVKSNNFKYWGDVEKLLVLEYIEKLGYKLEDLEISYEARLNFNIDSMLDWSDNYEYKGPKSFKIKQGLFTT